MLDEKTQGIYQIMNSRTDGKLLRLERGTVALMQWEFLLNIPSITFNEWQTYGLAIRDVFRKRATHDIIKKSLDIIRDVCLYGHLESDPDFDLLLSILSRHLSEQDFHKRVQLVSDWIRSEATEPPQQLIDDFDAIIAETLAEKGKKGKN